VTLTRRRFLVVTCATACASGIAFQAALPSWASAFDLALLDPVCPRCPHLRAEHRQPWEFTNRLYWTFLAPDEIGSCCVLCLSPECPDFQKWAAWDRKQQFATQALRNARAIRSEAKPSEVQVVDTAHPTPETSDGLPEHVATAPRPGLSRVSSQLFDLLQATPSGLPDELIAALLWPNMSSERALHNVQAAVYRLRLELGSKSAVRWQFRRYALDAELVRPMA
jgi:hypothetical protein